jgi:hypothetical protein
MRIAVAPLSVMSMRARLHDLRDDWPLTSLGFALLVTTIVLVIRRGTAARWVGFAVAALFWLAVNGTVEGPTLLRVVRRHGMTLGDLLPVALAVVAGAVVLHRRRAAVRSAARRAR